MSNTKKQDNQDPFMSIDAEQLANVAGGAARVTARASGANSELTAMLTSIGDSIKDLALEQELVGPGPMQMMMMMMMMGGMGGRRRRGPAAARPRLRPQINVSVKRGC